MANPLRGSVPLQVGDRTYTLSFSINALCELESELDQPVASIIKTIQTPEALRLSTVRSLVWAGLQDHHAGISLVEVGLMISEAGLQPTIAKVGEAFRLAFPQAEAAKGKPNPRRAKG
ncbi:hypothetical protein OV14_0052 [Ensifer adhaerens OV14]|nr:hypothetical protein OV14_0052 [Ensifer adhaerens OV14]